MVINPNIDALVKIADKFEKNTWEHQQLHHVAAELAYWQARAERKDRGNG